MAITIRPKPDGPYLVDCSAGDCHLFDAQGNEIDLSGKKLIALCRCGGSVKKPFCDGAHSRIGFRAAEGAVQKQEETNPAQT